MRYLVACILLMLSFLLLAGCAGMQESDAEREIGKRAPQIIGPAYSYTAKVRGLSKTHADTVQVTGIRVRPTQNLVLETLLLTFHDVTFRQKPFRVLNIGNAEFSAKATDQAVTNYVSQEGRATRPGIHQFKVTFLPNAVQVAAIVTVSGQDVPVTTSGTLQIVEETRVNYLPQTITAAEVVLPPDLLQQISTRINPLADLSGLRFHPQVRQLTLAPGILTLSGTANVKNFP